MALTKAQRELLQERLQHLKSEKNTELIIFIVLVVIGMFVSLILFVVFFVIGLWREYTIGKEIKEIEYKLAGVARRSKK